MRFTTLLLLLSLYLNLSGQEADQLWKKAESFQKLEQYDSAIFYHQLFADQIQADDGSLEDTVGWAKSKNRLAECFINTSDFVKAEEILQEVSKFYERSQGTNTLEFATTLNNQGKLNLENSKYELAKKYLNQALVVRLKLAGEKSDPVGETYYNLGQVNYQMSKFQTAIGLFRKAVAATDSANYVQKAKIQLLIGNAYYVQGNIDSAIEDYFKTIFFLEKANLKKFVYASAHNNIGACYYLKGDYKRSLESFEKALAIRLNILPEGHPEIARSYSNLGSIATSRGDYAKALDYLTKAYNMRVRTLRENHIDVGRTIESLGRVYNNLGQSKKAIEYHTRALEIYQLNLKSGHPYITECYINLAEDYQAVGSLEQSYFNYSKAEKNLLESSDSPYRAQVYGGLAEVFLEMGDFSNSLKEFKRAEESLISDFGLKHPSLSEVYLGIEKLFRTQKQYEKALKNSQRALVANTTYFDSDDILKNPDENGVLSQPVLLSALLSKARNFKLKGAYSNDVKWLEASLETIERASEVAEKIRNSFISVESKLDLNKKTDQLYKVGVEVSHLLYESNGRDEYKEMAWKFSELGKANTLLGSQSESDARVYANIPSEILQKERQLLLDQAFYREKIISSVNKDSLRRIYEDSLIVLKERREDLINRLEQAYPNYHQHKYQKRISGFSQIAQELDEDEALIEYALTEDQIFVFVATRTKTFIRKISTDSLLNNVIFFKKSISNPENALFIELGKKLYESLVAPLGDIEAKKWKIVPDGTLNYIPFELLVDENEEYLFENRQISYTYSASVGSVMTAKETDAGTRIGAFALQLNAQQRNSGSDSIRNTLSDLLGTTTEVNRINDIFDGDVYLNADASESTIEKVISDYNLIHFATHALVDDEHPDNSRLVLNVDSDSLNDGYLHAYEIYNLDLNAQLVTLSACNTGFGKIRKGEGVMSLSRAFAYAGVPATVVSLWPASDKSTPELMTNFYQNLKDGQAKDVALNNARKQYLATAKGKARHPFYWGGFVLIGDSSPLEEDSNFLIWVVPSILIIALVLALYRKKNKATAA